jgi:hypothetical protein
VPAAGPARVLAKPALRPVRALSRSHRPARAPSRRGPTSAGTGASDGAQSTTNSRAPPGELDRCASAPSATW